MPDILDRHKYILTPTLLCSLSRSILEEVVVETVTSQQRAGSNDLCGSLYFDIYNVL